MKLNDRLKKVASLTEKDNHVIDVGCDHALLGIYLINQKLVKSVVASDNKEGPVLQAIKNIKNAGLEKEIKVTLENGIENLDKEIDTIIISGMGGLNMVGICKYLEDEMKQINTIILSPNNELIKVRKEFVKMGFLIDAECLVKDNNTIYPVIRFKRGHKRYHNMDYQVGPLMINDKLFLELNQKEIKQKEILLSIMPKKYWMKKYNIKQELKIREKLKK